MLRQRHKSHPYLIVFLFLVCFVCDCNNRFNQIDSFNIRCGPCLLMSPEFEAAAKELEGKVRFVKLDTDQEQIMANKLAINGLPTLLFLDKFTPPEGSNEEEKEAKAVLKGRIEGAIQKKDILDFCEHYFFGGPEPSIGGPQ